VTSVLATLGRMNSLEGEDILASDLLETKAKKVSPNNNTAAPSKDSGSLECCRLYLILQFIDSRIQTGEITPDWETEEITSALSVIHQRWEKMERVEIIRDALINGLLSLAQGYLQWRRQKSITPNTTVI